MSKESKGIEERGKKLAEGFSSIFGRVKEEPASSKEKDMGKGGDEFIEIRKSKIFSGISGLFSKTPEILYYFLLLIIIWIGTWIRTRGIPLIQEGALPADPDSALFLRYMQTIIEQGSLPLIDNLRYVPLGFNTLAESRFLSYFLAYMYKVLSIFNPTISIVRVDMLYPIILTPFILIAFFFLVKRIFDWKIGLVATAFLAVIPAFLQRTMLGFSDKEPLGMLLFFLTFYFLVSGWKENNLKIAVIYGLLSGLFAGFLGLTWGAISFAFMIIGLSLFLFLLLENFRKKDFAVYLAFIISMTPVLFISTRYNLLSLLLDPSSAIIYLPLFAYLFYFFMQSKLKEKLIFKLPHNVSSILITFVIGIIGFVFIKGFSSLISLISQIKLQLLHPFGVIRLTLTVAENQQPFISTWISNFGYFFWFMIFGAILLSYLIFLVFDNQYKYWFTGISTIFIFALIFSRYKPDSIFNGTNAISQIIYFGGMILLFVCLIYVYLKTFYTDRDNFAKFSEIDKALLFTFIWFVWTAIGARGAIRLLFLFTPTVTVLGALLIVKATEFGLKFKDNVFKIGSMILILIIVVPLFYNLTQASISQTTGSYPNLHPQWTNAMTWVKNNVEEDAVFAHWWDYGYWIQTAGERATVLDGGNALPYWDHLMGRYVLTTPDDGDALTFLYTHNATHLLIDPTDIGKYPAYSAIGGDANYDRFSWINQFVLNEQLTQETRNGTTYLFAGGTPLDEEIIWQNEIFSSEKSGVGIAGIILPTIQQENLVRFNQPIAIVVKDGKRFDIPLNCIFFDGRIINFEGNGIDGCLYIIPKLTLDGQLNKIGTAFYLSPRTKDSLMVRLYLLGEDNSYFKLVHVEDEINIANIKAQAGLQIPSIIDFNGVRAPIKIWEIKYPEGIQIDPKYLEIEWPSKDLELSKGYY